MVRREALRANAEARDGGVVVGDEVTARAAILEGAGLVVHAVDGVRAASQAGGAVRSAERVRMLGPVRDEGVNLELGRRAEHLSLSHSSATHGVFAQVSHLRPALGGSRAFLGVLAPREPLQTLEPNRLRELGRKIERARTARARTSRGERGGRDHLSRLCVVIVFALRAIEPVRGHGGVHGRTNEWGAQR